MPPVAGVRATPAGLKLEDGFSTKITVGLDTDISFWEKSVKPPGFDGGDAIETTTMHNTKLRTMAPRQLKTLTEMTCTAAFDPDIYNQIYIIINRKTTITVRFPDGSTLAFFGYVKSFEPNDMSEGNFPEATVTIVPTNVDPTTGAEADPVLTSVAGT